MPIPSYSPIADNEIDPESPITSSLLFRLRDNILSILGIDPSNPSPVFTLAPSALVTDTATVADEAQTNVDTRELSAIVSRDGNACEYVEREYHNGTATTGLIDATIVENGNPSRNAQVYIHTVEIVWSSGTPTSIVLDGVITQTPEAPIATFPYTFNIDGSYYDLAWIGGSSNGRIAVKAVHSTGVVTLYVKTYRLGGTNINLTINTRVRLVKFKAKAAP